MLKEILRSWCFSHHKSFWKSQENDFKCQKCGRVWKQRFGRLRKGGRVV